MRRLLTLALLLMPTLAWGQASTLVTGTATDSQATPYVNGTWTANLVNPSAAQPLWNGNANFVTAYSGSLDSTGSLSVTLPSNTGANAITVGGASTTSWRFNVCASDGESCFVSSTIQVTGASQSISATLTNAGRISFGLGEPNQPTCAAGQVVVSLGGNLEWGCGAAGGSGTVTSVSAGTLSPLFTTSVATPTTTPAISFTPTNAGANTVLGNATGSPASPSYAQVVQGQVTNGYDDLSSNQTVGGNKTFSGTTGVKTFETTVYIDSANSQAWTGSDAGAWFNAAIATCPSTGCNAVYAAGAYTVSTAMSVTKPVTISCPAGPDATVLTWTPTTGVMLTFNPSNQSVGLTGCFLKHTPTLANGSGDTTLAVKLATVNQAQLEKFHINGFHGGIWVTGDGSTTHSTGTRIRDYLIDGTTGTGGFGIAIDHGGDNYLANFEWYVGAEFALTPTAVGAGTGVYTINSFAGAASNGLAGLSVTASGFGSAANNGGFTITASTTTTITTTNASSVNSGTMGTLATADILSTGLILDYNVGGLYTSGTGTFEGGLHSMQVQQTNQVGTAAAGNGWGTGGGTYGGPPGAIFPTSITFDNATGGDGILFDASLAGSAVRFYASSSWVRYSGRNGGACVVNGANGVNIQGGADINFYGGNMTGNCAWGYRNNSTGAQFSVANVTVDSNNQSNTAGVGGMLFTVNPTNFRVVGNRSGDDATDGGFQAYGLDISTASNTGLFAANDFRNNTTSRIKLPAALGSIGVDTPDFGSGTGLEILGGTILVEGTCPAGVNASDVLCGDATSHRLKMLNNNGTIDFVTGDATTDTFTAVKTFGTGSSLNFTGLLASPTAPTIAGAGCGGTVAAISAPNGTASFNIFTGTAPTSGGCTITMPAATTDWHCEANHVSAISTTNFIIQQTGALSTTSVTLQLFSDVAAATAPAASDTWRVTCTAN
jgi:hypothetical protein